MENDIAPVQTTPQPAPAGPPAGVAVVPATPTPQPQPGAPGQPMPMATGGEVKSNLVNVNWVEIGGLILGAVLFYTLIFYYKYKTHQYTVQQTADKVRIAQLSSKVTALEKVVYSGGEEEEDNVTQMSNSVGNIFARRA